MPGEPIGKCYKCGANLYATFGLCASCELVEVKEKNEKLMKALKLAYEAMNYLGDILNRHDMAQPEDKVATKEAFEVVSNIVGLTQS